MSPRFSTLAEWLAWQETLHPKKIDLGLERIDRVREGMGLQRPAPIVITVAGTNGKGSTVAMIDAILQAAGFRVGTYTSPHLFRYNERICINGEPVDDTTLCDAFERIDKTREDISLSYFEFGTLAALDILEQQRPDVALLEVGMGGRLDAVNTVDADCAIVTAIGIDHGDWLGADRAQIAREKAGIFRTRRPAICGDPNPPASLRNIAADVGAELFVQDENFGYRKTTGSWAWWGPDQAYASLPALALEGGFQLQNASTALMALRVLHVDLPLVGAAIEQGLTQVRLPGRLQVVAGPVQCIFDVGHNPHAAVALANYLADHPCSGRTVAVFGMLADKDVRSVVQVLEPQFGHWYLGGVRDARGLSVERLAALSGLGADVRTCSATLAEAYARGMGEAESGDRIIITGSFAGVAGLLGETTGVNP